MKSRSRGRVDGRSFEDALKVARMYYHLDLTTADIARQLGVTRPAVSRLLSWARAHGLVEFRVLDHRQKQLHLETQLESRYGVRDVKVVPVHPDASDDEALEAVTSFAAHFVYGLIAPGTAITIAWGATISRLAEKLIPKPTTGVDIVQMNGSGNSGQGFSYAANIISAFAERFDASAHLLPVPAFFDDPRTKDAMFRERSIRRVRQLAESAQIALFSIGVPDADSHIYRAGYVEDDDLVALTRDGAVGDIATVFFRADGSYEDLAMNRRSSGPGLSWLADRQWSVCIVAGRKKAAAVRGALLGGFMNTLLIDEPTATLLCDHQ